MRRGSSLLVAAALAVGLAPHPSMGQGVLSDVTVRQAFFARFDGEEPKRRVDIVGSARVGAFAVAHVPNEPAPGTTSAFEGCVEIRRGPKLKIRDQGCGEFTMAADPTLTAGSFVGEIPSEHGTITVAITFAGTEPPDPPTIFHTIPPSFIAQVSVTRMATAVGIAMNDGGEGFGEPVTSTVAVIGQHINAMAHVLV